jgi:hypothetical protein
MSFPGCTQHPVSGEYAHSLTGDNAVLIPLRIARSMRSQIPSPSERRKILTAGPLSQILVIRERSGYSRLELDSIVVMSRMMMT